jgi:hypothetical protein
MRAPECRPAAGARPHGEADAELCEGLSQARQERRQRCSGNLRGSDAAIDAVCSDQDAGTTDWLDAGTGPDKCWYGRARCFRMPLIDAVDGAHSAASKCRSRPWARLARLALILRSQCFTAPIMCRGASFDPDQARRQAAKELQHLRAADALAHHHRATLINPVHLDPRHMAELGIISAKGRNGTVELLQIIGDAADDRIPSVARFCLDLLARQYLTLNAGVSAIQARLHA